MNIFYLFFFLIFLNCIFFLETKNGLIEDTKLDLLDENLSIKDREKKMALCFELTQKEFIEKRDIYQKVAASIKEQEKINASDALRALFHQNLVTCYFNLNKNDLTSIINGSFNKEKLMEIFTATESTPMKFSSNQLKILEKIISSDNKIKKDNSGSSLKYLSGFYGYLYFISAISLIGFSFYYVLSRLNKEEKTQKRKKKNKKD